MRTVKRIERFLVF